MRVECMCCETHLYDKEGGEPDEVTSGICIPCLETCYPEQAPKVKVLKCCNVCPERTLKCMLVACDDLSKILDNIDAGLERRSHEAKPNF